MTTDYKEYVDTLANKMASQIDFEILSDVYLSMGWVKLEMTRPVNLFELADIATWLKQNCKGRYATHENVVLFERASDSTWFSIRWSS